MLASILTAFDAATPAPQSRVRPPCWNADGMGADPTRRHPWRLAAWLVFVGIVSAVNYLGRLFDTETPDDLAYRYSTSVVVVIQYLVFLGIALLISWRLPLREAYALRRPVSWGRAGRLTFVALVTIWGAAFLYSLLLSFVSDVDPAEEQGLVPNGWDSSRAGAFVVFFVAVTFLGPFVEELLFRGLGFTLVGAYGSKTAAILTTGVLFGLYHGLLAALLVLIVFGIVIGWLRARTASLYPCVALHSAFNGVALIASVTVLG